MDTLIGKIEDFINELEEASNNLIYADLPMNKDGKTINAIAHAMNTQKSFIYAQCADKLRVILDDYAHDYAECDKRAEDYKRD